MKTQNLPAIRALHPVWNKGRSVGQKRPLKPVRFEISEGTRASLAKWMEQPADGLVRVPMARALSRAVAHFDPPVCPHCAEMGFGDWFRSDGLWHSLNAPHESHVDIQEGGYLARSSASIGSHQYGQYGALTLR